MSDYSIENITKFAKQANLDLGSGKYKADDLTIDYCKAINIIMQLLERSPSDVKLVEAIKVLDPCDKCEWEFDPEYIACPCHHKKVRDEALAEHKQ